MKEEIIILCVIWKKKKRKYICQHDFIP